MKNETIINIISALLIILVLSIFVFCVLDDMDSEKNFCLKHNLEYDYIRGGECFIVENDTLIIFPIIYNNNNIYFKNNGGINGR